MAVANSPLFNEPERRALDAVVIGLPEINLLKSSFHPRPVSHGSRWRTLTERSAICLRVARNISHRTVAIDDRLRRFVVVNLNSSSVVPDVKIIADRIAGTTL
jgi:hypothetical protein